MTRRDEDSERDLARLRDEMGIVDTEDLPVISTPHDRRGNGRKWWQETWGKAIGTVLGGVLLGVVWWTWGVAVAFKAATVEVYSLPPRVNAHEAQIRAIQAQIGSPRPMSSPEVEALADALAARIKRK